MTKDKFNAATFDMIKNLAQNKDNKIKFSASKDGSQREYVLISSDTDEEIFTIKYRENKIGNAPYRLDLIIDGNNVNLPHEMISDVMKILKERSVAKKEAAKLAQQHDDQAAVLNFLGRFQSRK